MGIVKVSIYQKTLDDGLNLSTLKKIASLKSDFLLLPEYFFADPAVKDHSALVDKSTYAQDWLLKLNDAYKGIILGGSMIRKGDEGQFASVPIISEGKIVDWYDKRELSGNEKRYLKAGDGAGIFILGGFRFGVLAGGDATKKNLEELADQDVKLVFILDTRESYDESRDDQPLLDLAGDRGMYIARCSGAGHIFGTALSGRSLVATPAGISWRVAPQEEDREILKTVLINLVA